MTENERYVIENKRDVKDKLCGMFSNILYSTIENERYLIENEKDVKDKLSVWLSLPCLNLNDVKLSFECPNDVKKI